MFFTSDTRRLKSAIDAQDAHLGQSLADLAAAVGLGKAGTRAAGIARAHPVPVALAGAGLAGAAIALLMLRSPARDSAGEETADDWMAAARAARDAARDRLLELYEQGRATAEARAAVAAEQAEAVAAAMRQGLDHLGEEAAGLALEARRRAWEAVEEGGRIAGRGLDRGRRVAREHPVAATAAGLAAGAGLVALLLRGRGVLKVLAPVALAAAVTELALRLRRNGGVEETAEELKETADEAIRSAGKTVRRASRKAEAAGGKVTRAAAEGAKTATRRARAAAKTGTAKAAKAARKPAERAADAAEAALNGVSAAH